MRANSDLYLSGGGPLSPDRQRNAQEHRANKGTDQTKGSHSAQRTEYYQ